MSKAQDSQGIKGTGVAKGNKETKGLLFMGLQFNVIDHRWQLRLNKEISVSEYFLLEAIEMGTIGARNPKHQICSESEFYLQDLSSILGYKTPMKIWKLLKDLHGKKLIVRKRTRSKASEILGLNPEKFGQILIDSQHEIEQKRYLKLVPKPPVDNPEQTSDNSENGVDNFNSEQTNHLEETNESFADDKQNVCEEQPDRLQTPSQEVSLDCLRLIQNTLRGQIGCGGSFTPSKGNGNKTATKEAIKQQFAAIGQSMAKEG